jgi:hypothetical protein
MTQTSIPVQPHETAVTAALRTLAAVAGWCVTATTNGQHATSSLHYVGRAVDLASLAGPGTDTAQLLDINHAVMHLLPLSMISELIYAEAGAICVHDGKIVDGLAVYGAETMHQHHNHVHLGVIPTFTYSGPAPPALAPAPAPQPTIGPVHDFEENAVKQTMIRVGPLDSNGNGWADWQPGLGRDPNPVGLVLLGPSPPDDGYWEGQSKVVVAAQPRGGALRVAVRGGTPSDTVTCFVTVS